MLAPFSLYNWETQQRHVTYLTTKTTARKTRTGNDGHTGFPCFDKPVPAQGGGYVGRPPTNSSNNGGGILFTWCAADLGIMVAIEILVWCLFTQLNACPDPFHDWDSS